MDNNLFKQMKKYEDNTGIKPLDLKTKRSNVVYTRQEKQYDRETGEVTFDNNVSVRKIKTYNEFIQVYVENINFLWGLSPTALMVLTAIIKLMGYNNVVILGAEAKQQLQDNLELSRATIFKLIKELIDKNVLILINTPELKAEYEISVNNNKSYLVNPNIVGKGSFRELEKLRHTIVREYDVDKLELRTSVITDFDYGLANELQGKEHEVVGIEEKIDDNGNRNSEIFIAEKPNDFKNEEYIDMEPTEIENNLFPEEKQMEKNGNVKNNNSTEIELLKEQIELLKAEIRKQSEINLKEEWQKEIELERIRAENLRLELEKADMDFKNKLVEKGYIEEAIEYKDKDSKF